MNLDSSIITPVLSSRVPAGGAVFQIAPGGKHGLWVASPAGLFHDKGEDWHMIAKGLPLAQIGTVCTAGKIILAAGLGGGVVRSVDGGHTWSMAIADQTTAPVTCFAASPTCTQDGVFLAGTHGNGLLRSMDSGRIWTLANFGLHNFSIISLAVAGNWGRREWVFAGSENGIYISPNGGRAWKFSGLEGQVILSLAASPDFDQDSTLLAGLEEGGLFRSTDGGRTWQTVKLGIAKDDTVNAICYEWAGRIWVATQEHGVLTSPDNGDTWQACVGAPEDVFCLAVDDDILFAGALESGLWSHRGTGMDYPGNNIQLPEAVADGQGEKVEGWKQTSLSARRFHWLIPLPSNWQRGSESRDFLTAGLQAGAWLVSEGHLPWQPFDLGQIVPENGEVPPILSIAAEDKALFIGVSDGAWRCRAPDAGWEKVLETSQVITALAGLVSLVCAGSAAGELWFSKDSGESWQMLQPPGSGGQILSLGTAPSMAPGVTTPTLLMALLDEARGEVQIWHSSSPTSAYPAWELWFAERSPWRSVRLAFGGPGAGQWAVALGVDILRQASNETIRSGSIALRHPSWQWAQITTEEAPVNALIWWPREHLWLASAGERILASPDLETWQPLPGWPENQAVTAFSLRTDGELYALTMDGRLWKIRRKK